MATTPAHNCSSNQSFLISLTPLLKQVFIQEGEDIEPLGIAVMDYLIWV